MRCILLDRGVSVGISVGQCVRDKKNKETTKTSGWWKGTKGESPLVYVHLCKYTYQKMVHVKLKGNVPMTIQEVHARQ